MLVSYKSYPFINPSTNKPPVTGDEFLYHWADTTLIIHKQSFNPILKHPLGLLVWVALLFFILVDGFTENEQLVEYSLIGFLFILVISLYTGSIRSFPNCVGFYFDERKWKKQVIRDWKSDRLKYKCSESTLNVETK